MIEQKPQTSPNTFDIHSAEKKEWAQDCFAWILSNDEQCTIMQEKMCPHSADELHYHESSNQFVYVLTGTLQIELDGHIVTLKPLQGLKIPKKTPHRVMNVSDQAVDFLLLSLPGHREDRVLVGSK